MGGYGSGRWQSYQARDTVEGTLTLNIFKLYRENIITPGARHAGVFSAGNNRMHFTLADNLLTLSYGFTKGPHAGQSMQYAIEIEETHPNFGGVRLWFRCPTCGRRAGKLHLARLKYECRACADLAYQSTREPTARKLLAACYARDRRIERICQKYGIPRP